MGKISLSKITRKGKAIYLAYDHGLEHGPIEFNDKNVDPLYIIKIAKEGDYNGVIFQKGIAEKYYEEIKKSKVPLIIKLNGKTKIRKGEPYSPPLGSVEEALKLGASGVGYTIYLGSEHESKMFKEFEKIQKDAHSKGIPVLVWLYPRGKAVKNDVSKEMMAYVARIGLELGADIIKMKYGGKKPHLEWAVKSAGKTKIVISGGDKKRENEFLKEVKDVMDAGAIGLAVGRNVWQSKSPMKITNQIKKIVFG